MESSVKQRLILYLKEKKLGQSKFEKMAGLSNGYINSLKHSPSPAKLQNILEAFPDLDRTWLLTGEGSMLKQETDQKSSPCFDLATIQGGAGHGTGGEQILPGQEVGRIQVPGLTTGNDIPYIQVMGNSMVNRRDPTHSIPEGAWVGVRPSTLKSIRWGEVYAIMTTDGPIIKKVMQSEREGCLRCVSFNVEDGFMPFDLDWNEIILPLYNVIGVVSIKRWI